MTSSTGQLLVMAKAPVPGQVKTRLCPPCTAEQAARVAAAALADTVDAVSAVPAVERTFVLSGQYLAPAGWWVVPQRGNGLAERLSNGFADSVRVGRPSLLVGMDTPQVSPALLVAALAVLIDSGVDAVLGPATDGGWWALGLHDPAHADVLPGVPMSTPRTGAMTLAALRARGLRVAELPELRDVDTADDAWVVADLCPPTGRFPHAVRSDVPQPAVAS
jgi:rSAM/selenodomain-associated transferase 1